MTPDRTPDQPAEADHAGQAAFLALVAAQDAGATVRSSRELVAERFGLSPEQVRAVEREGLDRLWPPLS